MTDEALRYRAFLSYSHRDSRAATRLHRRLEGWTVPRAMRGVRADGSTLGARLGRVFRDREELASAGSLSRSIADALDASAALVVLCSPAAVASRWVGEEIAYFRRRHPRRPLLAFVVDGDPGADPRSDPVRAAFPVELALADLDDRDGPLGEPVAADARVDGDGFQAAFVKLVAGLLSVRYDELRRREARRRQRRWAALAVASTTLALVFAVLALQARRARDVARLAQARAELELTSERQTREFLLSVFRLADANEARGASVTVREVLDRAVTRVDRAELSRHDVRARFLATMGQAYASLGLTRRGVELLTQSIDEAGVGDAQGDLGAQRVDSRLELADLLYSMGEYGPATDALDAIGDAARLPWRQRARLGNVRGDVAMRTEHDDDARGAYQAALDASATGESSAPRDAALARSRSLSGLASLANFAGDYAGAERAYEQVVQLLERVVGADHPDTITARAARGACSYQLGDRTAARADWLAALDAARRVYDAGSPVIAEIESNLGRLLLDSGDPAGAEPLLRDALASDRKYMSENFDDLAYPLFNLAVVRYAQGDRDESRHLLEEALPIAADSHHRMHGPILATLADLECNGGDPARGIELAARAVEVSVEHADVSPWYVAQAELTRAYCGAASGKPVDPAGAPPLANAIEHHWGAASPISIRAREQGRMIERATRR